MFFTDEQIKKRVEQSSRLVLINIAENIRYLRNKRKLSRNKLIAALLSNYGIKMSYNGLVQLEWSQKKRNVELKTLAVLAMFFNIPLDNLMFINFEQHEIFESMRERQR